MAANPTLPTVPSSVSDPKSGPITAAFGSQFLSMVSQAQAIVDAFAHVREARTKTESLLEKGNSPEAIRYRGLKAKADEKLSAIKDDEKYAEDRATIKALTEKINADIKERSENIRNVVKEAKDAATKAEIGEVVSDVDPASLAKQLTDINSTLTAAKNMLVGENPELKGWRPLGVGAVTGSAPGEGKWKPRFGGAKVNSQDVPFSGKYVTATDIAKVAGVEDSNHFVNGLQETGLGGLRVLPSDKWTEFSLTVNGAPVQFAVIGRESASTDSADENTPDVSTD